MSYVKRPNGFRAVRLRGKTEVVYCVEHDKQVDVFEECGKWKTFTANEFNATHAREYSPMPDAVRAMFEGKPSFAELWDSRQK